MDDEMLSKADLWVSINRTADRLKQLRGQLARTVERVMAQAIADEQRMGRVNEEGQVIMTPFLAAKVKRGIDRAFDDMYGSRPGEPSPLEQIIVEEARMARLLALRRAAEQAQRELGPIKMRVFQETVVEADQQMIEELQKYNQPLLLPWRGNG